MDGGAKEPELKASVQALLGKSKNICFQMAQRSQVTINIQTEMLVEINPPFIFPVICSALFVANYPS